MAESTDSIRDFIRKSSDKKFRDAVNNPLPPPENKKDALGKWVWLRWEEAVNEKKRLNLPAKWLRNHEMIRGRHWPKHGQRGLITAGLPFQTKEHTKANLTDNRPQFDVRSYDEERKEVAEVLHKVGSAWWLETEQQDMLERSADNMETYGTTIEKMVFDHSYYGGEAEIDLIDPFTFAGEPKKLKINKMRYCFHYYPMTIEDIGFTFGWDKAEKVKPQEHFPELGEEREQNYGGSLAKAAPTGNLPTTYGREPIGEGHQVGTDRALVVECWIRGVDPQRYVERIIDTEGKTEIDPTKITPELEEIMAQTPERFQHIEKEKYPGGIRVVWVTNDGNLILDDMGNPMINPDLPIPMVEDSYLYKNFPFLEGQSYTDNLSFWGFSLIEQTEILVMEINKYISKLSEAVNKILKMQLVNPKNSRIPDGDFKKDIIHPINHIVAQGIRHLQHFGIPLEVFKYIELLKLVYDQVTGIHDVEEGRKPSGVTAASAIVALQEKAQVIIRRKIRTVDRIVRERGRMYISMVQNWHTELRDVIHEVEQEAEVFQYRGTDLWGRFQFKEEAGSTLPTSKIFQRQEALEMYKGGGFGPQGSPEAVESLLTEFRYPNSQEIIKRVQMGFVGMIVQKLEMAGFPPEMIEQFAQVAVMEPKEIEAAIKEQEQRAAQTPA